MSKKAQSQKFVDKLAEGIATVARAIQPKPVVVRLSDFKTNEYRGLKGGEKYEIVEENPMLAGEDAADTSANGTMKLSDLNAKQSLNAEANGVSKTSTLCFQWSAPFGKPNSP